MPSVLLVDDDPAMCAMLASVFRDEGYRVVVERRADLALARVAGEHFDVVLSDVRMPGGSGIELAAAVGRLRPATPVILMTGHATADTADAAFRAGAFDCVAKPFELDIVLFTVARALESRAHRESQAANVAARS